jgi:3-hydroxyacyl-[acyl-carrier-protein] dehydratase
MTGAISFEMPMGIPEIQQCIPHRPPFLLVDRVTEVYPGKSIVGIKNISISDPILSGHFPGRPIVPGVVMIEGLAQAAAVLGHLTIPNGIASCMLTEISETRFRRQVIPGDVLRYDVKVLKSRNHFYWFEGIASVDGETAVQTTLSAYLK